MSLKTRERLLIIPMEIQVRELESRFLLACAAASRGWRVIIGEQDTVHRALSLFPAGVLYEKSISINRVGHLDTVAASRHVITSSDEESTAIYRDEDRFLAGRLSDETLERTSLVLCWSELQREIYNRHFPRFRDRFVNTGTGRTDIWRSEFRGIYQDQVAGLRQRFGRFILFNSNFSHVIHKDGPHAVLKVLHKHGKLKNPEIKSQIERMLVEGRANLDLFAAVLPKLRKWFPGHQLIVRPHPGEDVEFWNDTCLGIDGVHVVREGAATAWILASDALLHHGCTTGVEAGLLGAAQVVYAPLPDAVHDIDISTLAAPVVKTETDLRAALQQAVDGALPSAEASAPLARYFSALSGPFAFENVLDALDALAAPAHHSITLAPIKRFPDAKKRSALKSFTRRLRGKSNAPRFDPVKWKGVEVAELESLAKRFREATPKIGPVRIEALHAEIFAVSAA